ncbi:unnamed protein product [Owenia fusiformis]|uniref:Uncharacterized protein n=1 Tax=Owenia fusiformis TaxID=6347 RepID=A0A8S4P486_OWEFU|nr:unnamed protein product [Owenia fusiformis]
MHSLPITKILYKHTGRELVEHVNPLHFKCRGIYISTDGFFSKVHYTSRLLLLEHHCFKMKLALLILVIFAVGATATSEGLLKRLFTLLAEENSEEIEGGRFEKKSWDSVKSQVEEPEDLKECCADICQRTGTKCWKCKVYDDCPKIDYGYNEDKCRKCKDWDRNYVNGQK